MSAEFILMGCGNSAGTPSIGNGWGACDPKDPRNRRTRPAALVKGERTTVLIDAGADLREQANRSGVVDIDAVLMTHAHSDHVAGIDELRVLSMRHKKFIPVWGSDATIDELQSRFSYMFEEKAKIYPQILTPRRIAGDEMGSVLAIGDIRFTPFDQDHGTCRSLGFRFGDLAYSTDMVDLPDESLVVLRGVAVWIVDGAGYNMAHNMVHATLRKVYELNDIVGARRVVLTHLPPSMDYATLCRELPDGYEPAYDGMVFPLDFSKTR